MTPNDSNQVQEASSAPAPTRDSRWRPIVVGTILAFCVAYAVFEGIESRVEAKTELHKVAISSAVPSVNVVLPKDGAEAEEIELQATPRHSPTLRSMPGPADTSSTGTWISARRSNRVSFLLLSRHRSSISNCNKPRLS